MTDRPILFSGPMVKAILDGSKTQTRRVLNPQPSKDTTGFQHVARDAKSGAPIFEALNSSGRPFSAFPKGKDFVTPYPTIRFAVGDQIWVRESLDQKAGRLRYSATGDDVPMDAQGSLEWLERRKQSSVPSIHMPRWASRLTLPVKDIRIERLRDISEDDAMAEGVQCDADGVWKHYSNPESGFTTATASFWSLWDSINDKRDGGIYSWEANPWVVAITFDVIKCNIDKIGDTDTGDGK